MEVQLYVLFEMHDQDLNSSIQFENTMSPTWMQVIIIYNTSEPSQYEYKVHITVPPLTKGGYCYKKNFQVRHVRSL